MPSADRRRLTLVAGQALLAVLLTALLLPAPALAQTTQVVEYYHTDALGSVRAVTNQQGQVIRRHDFMPFGEELQATVPPPDKPLFTGKERDAETGLDYFGARYQRAGVGRFTSVDPLMTFDENLVDPQRWNRYAYVRNNPLRYVDPDGRNASDISSEVGSDQDPKESQNSAEMGAGRFFWEYLRGVKDVTITPVVTPVLHPLDTLGDAVEGAMLLVTSPIQTVKNAGGQAITEIQHTVASALEGNPRAIGQVVGGIATPAFATTNVKLRQYPGSGGGGINILDAPTAKSRIGFVYHPIEGTYGAHIDVMIKKPGVPAGPNSNLLNIEHWPWKR